MKKSIAAGEFKAKCLALLDEVNEQGSEIIVTKRGEPVARLVPLEKKGPAKGKRSLYGWMKGTATITGDIVSPLYPDYDPGFPDGPSRSK